MFMPTHARCALDNSAHRRASDNSGALQEAGSTSMLHRRIRGRNEHPKAPRSEDWGRRGVGVGPVGAKRFRDQGGDLSALEANGPAWV